MLCRGLRAAYVDPCTNTPGGWSISIRAHGTYTYDSGGSILVHRRAAIL